MRSMNEQEQRIIAHQVIGEYLMNYIAGVMEMVQDRRAPNNAKLDEATLVAIEAQVKTIAEEFTHQSQMHPVESTPYRNSDEKTRQIRRLFLGEKHA